MRYVLSFVSLNRRSIKVIDLFTIECIRIPDRNLDRVHDGGGCYVNGLTFFFRRIISIQGIIP